MLRITGQTGTIPSSSPLQPGSSHAPDLAGVVCHTCQCFSDHPWGSLVIVVVADCGAGAVSAFPAAPCPRGLPRAAAAVGVDATLLSFTECAGARSQLLSVLLCLALICRGLWAHGL